MKKKKPTDNSVKEKSMFDMLNGIYTDQSVGFFDSLSDSEKKRYKSSRFIMNRFISMTPEYLPIVNELQLYPNMPDRCHYLFFANILPKKKVYSKYIKSETESLNSDDLKLVAKHFEISEKQARDYLKILQKDSENMKRLREMYGIK